MEPFVCPKCYLRTRPHALFFSRGATWWSVTSAEQKLYRDLCPHWQVWPNGTVLGCASMRTPIDAWLRAGAARPSEFGAGEVSIADVAIARHPVEARADVPVRIAPEISDFCRDPAARAALQRNPGTTAIDGFELRDTVLAAARMLLFRDGDRIAETRYLVDDNDYRMIPPAPRETHATGGGTTVVIGVNLAFRNYYHWLMQCLPAIEAGIATIGGGCVLALPPLAGWQEETLTRLGLAGVPRLRIDFDCHYRFAHAYWCAYLGGAAETYLSPRCLGLLDRLAATVPPIAEAPARIYVARFDSPNRVIGNENAVRHLLERHGFVTLVPGLLPFATQAGLFRAARIVVGGHGAGLTNIGFCQPGTTVLELLQSTYPSVWMNRIAQANGLRYVGECFDSAPADDVNRQPWTVDLARLEARLTEIL